MRRAVPAPEGRLDLVGRDLANLGRAQRAHRRWVMPAVAGCLLAALAVAALRIDLIRVRYGLADAMREEKALLEERRELLAQLRELRDPARLRRQAAAQGFVRPARIIDLPSPAPAAPSPGGMHP